MTLTQAPYLWSHTRLVRPGVIWGKLCAEQRKPHARLCPMAEPCQAGGSMHLGQALLLPSSIQGSQFAQIMLITDSTSRMHLAILLGCRCAACQAQL